MIKIGLTGGIGSGKTTVANIFLQFGIPIYNSDKRAKVLMIENKELVKEIKGLLGDNAYTKEQQLNRSYISEKVFKDKTLLKALNQLVHPKVGEDFKIWCNKHKFAEIIIKEAAILIESGAFKTLNKIVVVNAPEEVRINRVLNRDNSNLEAVKNRIQHQISEAERNSYADFIINNDGKNSLINQVKEIISKLKDKK